MNSGANQVQSEVSSFSAICFCVAFGLVDLKSMSQDYESKLN